MSNNDGFMNYEELAERLEEESFSIKTNTKKHPKKKQNVVVMTKIILSLHGKVIMKIY